MYNSPSQSYATWIASLVLGCWLTGGVTCPLKCQCVHNLYVYCDNQSISDGSLNTVVAAMPETTAFMDLSDNVLSTIQPSIFLRFNNLLDVDLSNNNFDNISVGVFKNLPSLQKIHLHGNRLTRLHNDTFYYLKNLKEVDLHNNGISAIDMCAFSHVPVLEKVNLRHNLLFNLTARNMMNFKHVRHLDLSYNDISFITDNAFAKLGELKTLVLSHNKIASISANSFQGLSVLENLHLDFNNIRGINRYDFNYFRTNLKKLTVSANEIQMLNSGVLMGMLKLEVLDLSYNQIYSLGSNVFQGLSLKDLSLKGNKLSEITRSILSGTRRIENLDLSLNEILSVSSDAFESFKDNILHLNMESNNLGNVLVGVFDGMKHVRTINLSNNTISFIEDGAFRDLVNLQKLDLSNNQLSIVTSEMFSDTTSLEYLDLYSNPVRKFHGDRFIKGPSLIKINLNLTVLEVNENSALITWPYIEGSQLYWSLYVKCIDAEYCPFRPQATSLPPYQEDVTISDLSPFSTYYVCVNPAFVNDNVIIQQCAFITTPRHVTIETTKTPVTQAATSDMSTITINKFLHTVVSLYAMYFTVIT